MAPGKMDGFLQVQNAEQHVLLLLLLLLFSHGLWCSVGMSISTWMVCNKDVSQICFSIILLDHHGNRRVLVKPHGSPPFSMAKKPPTRTRGLPRCTSLQCPAGCVSTEFRMAATWNGNHNHQNGGTFRHWHWLERTALWFGDLILTDHECFNKSLKWMWPRSVLNFWEPFWIFEVWWRLDLALPLATQIFTFSFFKVPLGSQKHVKPELRMNTWKYLWW